MILDVIRWVALIPALSLVNAFAMLPLLPVALAAERLGPRVGPILRSTVSGIAYLFYGAALVFVGGWVAPNHKVVVVDLVTIFSIFEAWRRCYIFSHFTKNAYLYAAATALGSIIVASQF